MFNRVVNENDDQEINEEKKSKVFSPYKIPEEDESACEKSSANLSRKSSGSQNIKRKINFNFGDEKDIPKEGKEKINNLVQQINKVIIVILYGFKDCVATRNHK